MNRWTSIAVDILWVLSLECAVVSFASWFAGNDHLQLYSAVLACFCVLQAVLLCVYKTGVGK